VAFKRVDITSHTNFEAAFEKCLDLFDGLDVVVNVAGVNGEIYWETQLQINLYVRCTPLSFIFSIVILHFKTSCGLCLCLSPWKNLGPFYPPPHDHFFPN
jgi:NAD(P)-dependent dehydrogenase (short-subunit alcohol dehydrogenase family)